MTPRRFLHVQYQAIVMIYRNMLIGRSRIALLALSGLVIVALVSGMKMYLYVIASGYSETMAIILGVLPLILWGVVFPMIIFLIDRKKT